MTGEPGRVASLIAAYAAGDVDDDSMTAFLREVCAHGLSIEETYDLTAAMARSGETIDWTGIDGPVVDKHSTGGVGDAVTLIAVPLAAAHGARVAKLSGRALGHTGGTIDKLECIPGLRTDLSIAELRSQVARVGCVVAAATENLAPADKKLYALRHRTNTVASIPLIAASVMSKKLAAGAPSIVLDVKFGRGAFMESMGDARALAQTMRQIGERAGRTVVTLLTRMDEPLADSAGDALELDEALSVLEGRGGSPALREIAVAVADAMLRAAGLRRGSVDAALRDGRALEKFRSMVAAQGGRLEDFDRTWPEGHSVGARHAGIVQRIDARAIGEAVADAKRRAPRAAAARFGVRIRKRVGAPVEGSAVLAMTWLPSEDSRLDDAFVVGASPPHRDALVAETAGSKAAGREPRARHEPGMTEA